MTSNASTLLTHALKVLSRKVHKFIREVTCRTLLFFGDPKSVAAGSVFYMCADKNYSQSLFLYLEAAHINAQLVCKFRISLYSYLVRPFVFRPPCFA